MGRARSDEEISQRIWFAVKGLFVTAWIFLIGWYRETEDDFDLDLDHITAFERFATTAVLSTFLAVVLAGVTASVRGTYRSARIAAFSAIAALAADVCFRIAFEEEGWDGPFIAVLPLLLYLWLFGWTAWTQSPNQSRSRVRLRPGTVARRRTARPADWEVEAYDLDPDESRPRRIEIRRANRPSDDS